MTEPEGEEVGYMRCKDCGRPIKKLYKGERLCGRCAIGYAYLYEQ